VTANWAQARLILRHRSAAISPRRKLDQGLPATSDNVELIEGVGRAIQKRFRGDAVWNVDRIMRLPGTVNVPSSDKAAQGRKPAATTVLLEESKKGGGKAFTLGQLAAWSPPIAAANASKRSKGVDKDYPFVDMKLVETLKTYDDLPRDLRERFEARSRRVISRLWTSECCLRSGRTAQTPRRLIRDTLPIRILPTPPTCRVPPGS
jgi:hypothetical protein